MQKLRQIFAREAHLLRSRYFWAAFFATFSLDITGRTQGRVLEDARKELAKRSA